MQQGKCQKLRRSFWKRIRETAANLQVRSSIFFCFSKRKRWRVRNDHDGTNPCRQGFLSSVLISSFPNRELNLRFGFSCKSVTTSQSRLRRASIPTPFVPSGHFPLIGGIGPWKGSQGMRTAGSTQKQATTSQSASLPAPLGGEPCGEKSPPRGARGLLFTVSAWFYPQNTLS